jgi:hypothetical protein
MGPVRHADDCFILEIVEELEAQRIMDLTGDAGIGLDTGHDSDIMTDA